MASDRDDGFDKVTLDHLRTLPDGSLTRAEVNLLIDYIERLERFGNALASAADPLLSDDVGHFMSAWEIDPHHGLDGEKLAESLRAALTAWRVGVDRD